MVGLVSAFGGKFGFFILLFFKKDTFNLFQYLNKRPTDVPVRSDGNLSFSLKTFL